MRSIQEIIFSLMIVVGLAMIAYDVIKSARTAGTIRLDKKKENVRR